MAVGINRSGNAFAAQVGRSVVRMQDYTKRVWQESIISLVQIMQTPVDAGGNMPVRTGFLRSSLDVDVQPVATNSEPRPAGISSFTYDPGPIETFIRAQAVGVKIFLGYRASYAYRAEYIGWGEIPGYRFTSLAVQRWQDVVSETIVNLRSL